MTLQQLEYFKVLATIRHYTNAARILHISQPSLSYAITALEEELGTILFDKRHKSITLTPAGKIFYSHVTKVLAMLEEGVAETRATGKAYRELVRIGSIYSMAFSLLPVIIEGYNRETGRDRVKFSFVQNVNDRLLEDLYLRRIDLAILSEPREDLEYLQIHQQELYVLVNSGHPLAENDRVKISQIKNEPLILTTGESGLRRFIDRAFLEAGTSSKILFESPECNAIVSHVALNQGVGIIPDIPGINYEGVKKLSIQGPGLKRPIYLAWLPGKGLTGAMEEFIDYLKRNPQMG